MPSKGESFGLVALEALIHFVPVAVFSDVGGALVLIKSGFNGFVLKNALELDNLWSLLDTNPDILNQYSNFIRQMDLSKYNVVNSRKKLEALICHR